ncbi:putative protein kinase RLK-Pelle-LRR-VII-3 family [Helianthus annuus]|nr:putative protein kinase RLK-Pelle-LRR-VII-3 family [Helianthus annuus]
MEQFFPSASFWILLFQKQRFKEEPNLSGKSNTKFDRSPWVFTSRSDNVRLLVYDYMPNGNLATLLQEAAHQDGHVLNWPMRHLIALGIARGLAFLHSIPMFHGDINHKTYS